MGIVYSESVLRCRFADNAHGYVGADLMAVVKEASMVALRRNSQNVHQLSDNDESGNSDHFVLSMNDVREAFQHVRPSGLREVAIDVPKVRLAVYFEFFVQYGINHPQL
jgi:SpoVK/Ycf46/Vps4 family AAA+-type ATPase